MYFCGCSQCWLFSFVFLRCIATFAIRDETDVVGPLVVFRTSGAGVV